VTDPTDPTDPTDATDPTDDPRRERGKALMKQVYGWDIDQVEGEFVLQTVDHLFGEVWAGGKLSVRDRRLVLIGLTAGSGLEDVAGLQLDAAVRLGELDADDLRYLVTFLAHYAGWPRAARLNTEVEKIIARLPRGDGTGAAPDPADDLP
jgi:4-carboxymuconolactone decarboxylase